MKKILFAVIVGFATSSFAGDSHNDQLFTFQRNYYDLTEKQAMNEFLSVARAELCQKASEVGSDGEWVQAIVDANYTRCKIVRSVMTGRAGVEGVSKIHCHLQGVFSHSFDYYKDTYYVNLPDHKFSPLVCTAKYEGDIIL